MSATKTLGAPAQHSQPSRKGKKAWRKHVDINEIEEGLDSLRDEEIITGAPLHAKPDDQLFQVDVKGDEKLKNRLPKYDASRLMSTKILAERSALPPVLSRPSTTSKHHRSKLSNSDKDRLLRIGKRNVKGPFNAIVDPTELGMGSALLEPTEAVKKSGTYDVWSASNQSLSTLKAKGNIEDPDGFLLPLVSRPTVKTPSSLQSHRCTELPAVTQPHQGTSYNPPPSAHQELLLMAHKEEERRELAAAKLVSLKQRIESARQELYGEAESGASGMLVDSVESNIKDENHADESPESVAHIYKPPARKTQKQRRKAAVLLSQKRALLERRRRRHFLATIPSARSLHSKAMLSLRSRQAALVARRAARAERLRREGLVGQRLGKHRVAGAPLDVSLREELSDNLRSMKPQGNLFRDRFLSLQHRALVEPRVLVMPTRRKRKIKEYEKHAWKRFE